MKAKDLKIIRETLHVGSSELARLSGVTRQTIWNIESGNVTPSEDTIDSIKESLRRIAILAESRDAERKEIVASALK